MCSLISCLNHAWISGHPDVHIGTQPGVHILHIPAQLPSGTCSGVSKAESGPANKQCTLLDNTAIGPACTTTNAHIALHMHLMLLQDDASMCANCRPAARQRHPSNFGVAWLHLASIPLPDCSGLTTKRTCVPSPCTVDRVKRRCDGQQASRCNWPDRAKSAPRQA